MTPEQAIALASARKRLQAPPTPVEQESPTSALNLAGAAVEPNLTLATGAIAAPISGYAGMLGSILPGPPGQGADWTRATQEALTWMPQTEGGKTATEAISYPFRKFGEGTDWLGEKTSEVSGSPALGAAVKAGLDVGVPYGVSRLAKMAPASETAQGQLAKWLMRKAVKPSPATPRHQSERAMGTMLEEGISPTSGGIDKARALARELDTQVGNEIAGSNATVNIPRAAGPLRDVTNRARMQSATDIDAVKGVWDDFRNLPDVKGKVDIPVQLAHELKKGQYRVAQDAYGELGSSAMEARKGLARGLREQEMSAVPSIKAPLAREANLMNVLDVAEQKVLAQMNNNPAGLALLTGNKAQFLAFMADRSAAFKGAMARMLYSAGNPEAARMALSSGGTAQTQELQRE